MAPILESADPPGREHARQLGLAFQLTNFIRDVAEDHRRGRVYLPAADLERFGVAPAGLAAAAATAGRGRAAGLRGRRPGLCGRRAGHRAARPLLPALCPGRLQQLYGAILDEVERAGYQVLPPGPSPATAASASPATTGPPPAPPPAPNAASASPPPAPDDPGSRWPWPWWWPGRRVPAVGQGLATPVGPEQAAASSWPARPAAAIYPAPAPGRCTATGPAGTSGSTGSGSSAPTRPRRSGWSPGGRLPLARDRAHLHPARRDLRLLRRRRRRRGLRLLDQPDLLPGAGRPAVRLRPGRPRLLTGTAPATPGAGAASRAPRPRPTPPSTSAPRRSRPRRPGRDPPSLLTALSGQSSGAVRDLWLAPDGLVVKEERGQRSRSARLRRPADLRRAGQLRSPAAPSPTRVGYFIGWRVRGGRCGMARTGRRPGVSGPGGDPGRRPAGVRRARLPARHHPHVADLAGVDPALVHHYFGTKQDLFVAAVQLPVNPVEQLMAVLAEDPARRAGGWWNVPVGLGPRRPRTRCWP